jgi:hypothetical protein
MTAIPTDPLVRAAGGLHCRLGGDSAELVDLRGL